MLDNFQLFHAENGRDQDQFDHDLANKLSSAVYVDAIPSWERAKQEERARKDADRALELETRAAELEAIKLLEERNAALLLEKAIVKAVEAGDIPKIAAEEFKKVPCPRGVGELIRKIAEKHGANPSCSNLDFVTDEVGGAIGLPMVQYVVAGADEKLLKMSSAEAISVLKDWIEDGKNPLKPGGALEQTLFVTRKHPPPVDKTETMDFGIYDFSVPLDEHRPSKAWQDSWTPPGWTSWSRAGVAEVPTKSRGATQSDSTKRDSSRMPSPFRKQTR